MRQSVKAALFSAFVFPGSGHFILKKPVQGSLLSGITILCVWALLSTAWEKAQEISQKIQSGEIPLDITRITEEVTKQTVGAGTQLVEIATYLLVICWLVGIVDSFRIGRLPDRGDNARDRHP